MSFNVKLQQNTSEPNRLTKSVTDVLSLDGTLKDGSSIIDPVILIEYNGALTAVNYMTIDTFGRKYFIKDIVSVNNKFWEVHAHVDVLSSFAAGIRACTGIVAKQENAWNLYLNDSEYKAYQDPYVTTQTFPAGFNTFQFVLALLGNYE